VVHEVSVEVSDDTKAPDDSFRIGGVRKFLLGASKPSVHIRDDAGERVVTHGTGSVSWSEERRERGNPG